MKILEIQVKKVTSDTSLQSETLFGSNKSYQDHEQLNRTGSKINVVKH